MSSVILTRSKDLTVDSIRVGYYNALTHLGHRVAMLEQENVVFDEFAKARPDLFITSTSELNRAVIRACDKYRPTIILFLEMDDRTTVEDMKQVELLLDTNLNIFPFVFWQDRLASPWQRWTDMLGLIPKTTTPAADTIRYKQGNHRAEFECDISYIGTWKPEKAVLLNNLEREARNGKVVRIYGYGNWNHPLHVGALLDDEDLQDAIVSAKINICIKNWSLDEKFLKIIACGGQTGFIGEVVGKTGIIKFDNDDIDISTREEFLLKENYINRIQEILKSANLV